MCHCPRSPTIRTRGAFMASWHFSPENDTLFTPKNRARRGLHEEWRDSFQVHHEGGQVSMVSRFDPGIKRGCIHDQNIFLQHSITITDSNSSNQLLPAECSPAPSSPPSSAPPASRPSTRRPAALPTRYAASSSRTRITLMPMP